MTQAPPELGIDLMSGDFYGADPYPAFAWSPSDGPGRRVTVLVAE